MAYETMRSVWLSRTDRQTPTVRARTLCGVWLLRRVCASRGAVSRVSSHQGGVQATKLAVVAGLLPTLSALAPWGVLTPLSPLLLFKPPSLPPTPSFQVAMSLACGSAAGVVSSTATFPLDLVRRRLQLYGQGGSGSAAAAAGSGGGPAAATFRSVLSGVVQVRWAGDAVLSAAGSRAGREAGFGVW